MNILIFFQFPSALSRQKSGRVEGVYRNFVLAHSLIYLPRPKNRRQHHHPSTTASHLRRKCPFFWGVLSLYGVIQQYKHTQMRRECASPVTRTRNADGILGAPWSLGRAGAKPFLTSDNFFFLARSSLVLGAGTLSWLLPQQAQLRGTLNHRCILQIWGRLPRTFLRAFRAFSSAEAWGRVTVDRGGAGAVEDTHAEGTLKATPKLGPGAIEARLTEYSVR